MSSDQHSSAAFFAAVSKDLMQPGEAGLTFDLVAKEAIEVVPACDHCAISLRTRRGQVTTVASSSPSARRWDELQHTLQQGPCVDAVWADDTYLAKDLAHDPRWPQWSPRVAAQGAGSVLAIRLASPDETLGALNMYADRANAFTADDVDLALIYASHAADAMSTAKLLTGLRIAVKSRHHIGIAQGILMLRYDLSQEQAFDTLRRYSSQTNIKIRDLAELVIETRGLPDLEILERGDPTRDHDADLPDSSAQESTSTG